VQATKTHKKNRILVIQTNVFKNTKSERQRQYDKRSLRRNRSLCRKIASRRKIQTRLLKENNFFLQKNSGGMEGKEVTGVIPEEEQQNFLKDRKISKYVFRIASLNTTRL
jgi:hypothetical protein